MIWECKWDFSSQVFLCIHEVYGNLLKVSLIFNDNPEKTLEIDEKISNKTLSLVIINISDILEKMAEIDPITK